MEESAKVTLPQKGVERCPPFRVSSSEGRGKDGVPNLPGRALTRDFFEALAERVAPRLLGKVLARRSEGCPTQWLAGRIVEVGPISARTTTRPTRRPTPIAAPLPETAFSSVPRVMRMFMQFTAVTSA